MTRPIEDPTFNFHLVNAEGVLVFAPKPFQIAGGEATVDAGEPIELSMTIDTMLAVGHYSVQCVVGREEPVREILGFRKHAIDFVVFGIQGFNGIAALEFEAGARRRPLRGRDRQGIRTGRRWFRESRAAECPSNVSLELRHQFHHYDPSQLAFQLQEVFTERAYLQHGIEIQRGDVVFDVGANVGVASVFFALECGAGAVHSFEPIGPIYDLLCQNLSGLPNCIPHDYGLAGEARRASITYYPGAAAMSGIYADPPTDRAVVRTALLNAGMSDDRAAKELAGRYRAQKLTCELRTLSDVFRELSVERVDLLKIDVEKAEMDVLDGIHEHDWPGFGSSSSRYTTSAGDLPRSRGAFAAADSPSRPARIR